MPRVAPLGRALPAPATVYAAAPNFLPDASHKPTPMPREVRLLKRGDIRRPGETAELVLRLRHCPISDRLGL